MRFCNRYVSDFPDAFGAGNVVAGAASTDLGDALLRIDGYKAGEVTVTGVDGTVEISRGQDQAFLRKVKLPRSIPRGTRKVRATVVLRHIRGERETRRVTVKLPPLRPGHRTLVFVGRDVDFSEGDLFEIFGFDFGGSGGGSLGPANVRALARSVEGIARYDGVTARPPRPRAERLLVGRPAASATRTCGSRARSGRRSASRSAEHAAPPARRRSRQAPARAARTSAGVSGSARNAAASAGVRSARSWRSRPTSTSCSRATVNGLPVSRSARGAASAARYQSPSSVGP